MCILITKIPQYSIKNNKVHTRKFYNFYFKLVLCLLPKLEHNPQDSPEFP